MTDEELEEIERGRVVLSGECGASDGYAKCTLPGGHGPVHWDKHTQHEFSDDESPFPDLPRRKDTPSELKIVHLSAADLADDQNRREWHQAGYAVVPLPPPGVSGVHPVGELCQACSRSKEKPGA